MKMPAVELLLGDGQMSTGMKNISRDSIEDNCVHTESPVVDWQTLASLTDPGVLDLIGREGAALVARHSSPADATEVRRLVRRLRELIGKAERRALAAWMPEE